MAAADVFSSISVHRHGVFAAGVLIRALDVYLPVKAAMTYGSSARRKTHNRAPPERTPQMALFVRTQDKDQTKNRIASFFGLSGGAKTRAGRSRTQRNWQFLGLEEMEGRTMMSNIPVFTSVQVPAYGSTVLPLAPMENSVAKGTFLPGQTSTGGVHANLTAGVLYTVSDDVQSSPQYTGYPATTAPSLLQVIDPSGSYVTFHSTYPGSTVNPETGLQTNDNTVIFRARRPGFILSSSAPNIRVLATP